MSIVVILQPVLTAECFGQRSFGRIYGPISLGIRIGSAVGPFALGVISVSAGSYQPALALIAAVLLVATVAIRWATPSRQTYHRTTGVGCQHERVKFLRGENRLMACRLGC